MNAAARFLAGVDDEQDRAAMRAAMATWLLTTGEGPDLHQMLGLGNRRSVRCAMRDTWLRRAAEHVDGGAWQKAEALADMSRTFEVRRWPRWKRNGPPAEASQIDQALFEARQFGSVSLSPRSWFNIIA